MAGKRYLNVNGELFFIYKQAAEVLENKYSESNAKEMPLDECTRFLNVYLKLNELPERKQDKTTNLAVSYALEKLQKIKCPHLKTVRIQ